MARNERQDAVDHLLGELEAPIMRVMWGRGAASVRDVLTALNADGRSVAYTTVMTVMARLTEKGLLSRERAGKRHVYRATSTQEGFLRHSAARRVHELIAEFGDLAVAQFVAEVDDLPPERRRQLARLAAGEDD